MSSMGPLIRANSSPDSGELEIYGRYHMSVNGERGKKWKQVADVGKSEGKLHINFMKDAEREIANCQLLMVELDELGTAQISKKFSCLKKLGVIHVKHEHTENKIMSGDSLIFHFDGILKAVLSLLSVYAGIGQLSEIVKVIMCGLIVNMKEKFLMTHEVNNKDVRLFMDAGDDVMVIIFNIHAVNGMCKEGSDKPGTTYALDFGFFGVSISEQMTHNEAVVRIILEAMNRLERDDELVKGGSTQSIDKYKEKIFYIETQERIKSLLEEYG